MRPENTFLYFTCYCQKHLNEHEFSEFSMLARIINTLFLYGFCFAVIHESWILFNAATCGTFFQIMSVCLFAMNEFVINEKIESSERLFADLNHAQITIYVAFNFDNLCAFPCYFEHIRAMKRQRKIQHIQRSVNLQIGV